MKVYVKYHNDKLSHIEKLENGDWIDLRAAETVHLRPGESKKISLGVSMKLPEGYEAHILPRSSTFDKWGIIQVNGEGIIDNSYCGNNDIWKFSALAFRDTTIYEGDRICQFRLYKKMEEFEDITVDDLGCKDRGGFGSTGSN